MAVLSIQMGSTGLAGVIPRIVYIDTNDTIATVTTTGFLNRYIQEGYNFQESDMCCVTTKLTPFAKSVDVGWFGVSYVAPNWSLVATNSAPSVTLPTVANKIAYFTNTTGNLASSIFSTPTVDGNLGDAITTDGAGAQRVATAPGRNRLINGDFQVWQRGAGGAAIIAVPASTIAYTADRWQLSTNANQACTITQSAGPTSGSYLCKVQRNNGQTGTGFINFASSLPRDMCIGAAGNVVTLSFKAKSGANYSAINSLLSIAAYSGTGTSDVSGISGSFTGSVNLINTAVTLTTTLTSFSVTSIVCGANVTQLAAQFGYAPLGTANIDDSFFVTDVQMEVSPNQTPFDRIGFQNTLLACQRFYCKSFQYSTVPAQNVGPGTGEHNFPANQAGALNNISNTIAFPVLMRTFVSAIAFYNPRIAGAAGQVADETANVDCSATALGGNNQRGFFISCTGNAGTAVSNTLGLHWTAETELT